MIIIKNIWRNVALGRVAIHYILLGIIGVIALFAAPLSKTWPIWLYIIIVAIMIRPKKEQVEFENKSEKFLNEIKQKNEKIDKEIKDNTKTINNTKKVDIAINRIRIDGKGTSNQRIYVGFAMNNVKNSLGFNEDLIIELDIYCSYKFYGTIQCLAQGSSSGINLLLPNDLKSANITKVVIRSIYTKIDKKRINFEVMD